MRALYNVLRSRKLAFWLIGAFVAYSAVATSVTKGDFGEAYANPLFYLIVTALALATASCAWERSVAARRLWRSANEVTAAFVRRLETAPQLRVPLAEGVEPGAAVAAVASGLAKSRLQVKQGERRVVGSTPRLSLVGSPLFHWALVTLFVLVVGGRLTRSEGLMGIPLGSEREDTAASYGQLDEGPLHGSGFSGLTIRVPDLTFGYIADGVDRGAVPLVELYRGDELVAAGPVYPNSPLRHGSVMVHPNAYGLSARFTLLRSGEVVDSLDVLYDFSEGDPIADDTSPMVFDREGVSRLIETRVPLDVRDGVAVHMLPQEPRVEWAIDEGPDASDGALRVGESLDLGQDAELRLDSATYYVRLSVVDDWSVYPMYAVLLLAVTGLALALLSAPKNAWVMLVESDGGVWLHARTRQSRADTMFAERVEDMLRCAAGGEDVS